MRPYGARNNAFPAYGCSLSQRHMEKLSPGLAPTSPRGRRDKDGHTVMAWFLTSSGPASSPTA